MQLFLQYLVYMASDESRALLTIVIFALIVGHAVGVGQLSWDCTAGRTAESHGNIGLWITMATPWR